jgi:predicted nucleic acid-binding protein
MSGKYFVDSNIWLYAFMDDTSTNAIFLIGNNNRYEV